MEIYQKKTVKIDWYSSKYKGLLIGFEGKAIKDIRLKSGAKIKITDNEYTVSGTEEQFDKAKMLMEEIVYSPRKGGNFSSTIEMIEWEDIKFVPSLNIVRFNVSRRQEWSIGIYSAEELKKYI